MKLLFALLSILQVSNALHIGRQTRTTSSQLLKRTAQDATSNNLPNPFAAGGPNTIPPKKSIPWWKLPNTHNGEMNAIAWSQIYPFDDEDDESNSDGSDASITADGSICIIKQCQSSEVLGKYNCGQNARCLNSYCQCNLGWKPASNVPMSRGWTGLETLTVWVEADNPGCTDRCDSLSCSEVLQLKGCFDQHVTHNTVKGSDNSKANQDGLATDALHLGAIKAPGANAGISV